MLRRKLTASTEALYAPSPSPSPPHSPGSPQSSPSLSPTLASQPLASQVAKALRSASPLHDPFSDAGGVASSDSEYPFADSHQVDEPGTPENGNPFDDSHETEPPADMVGPRNAAYAEESAEVEVLSANLEKLKGMTRKIQGSMTRVETSGKVVKEAIGPIYSNTQTLQNTNGNINRIKEAIDKICQPLDAKAREETIIRAGPRNTGLLEFLNSMTRTSTSLSELNVSNLRSSQQVAAELSNLLTQGNIQLQDLFLDILKKNMQPVEPLHYVTKGLSFPGLAQDQVQQLSQISAFISSSSRPSQLGQLGTPTARMFADIRGPYLASSLQNLATASINTTKKKSPNEMYRQGTNGIGMYASALEGIFFAEYDNICQIFPREEWGFVFDITSRNPLAEFAKTLRELNIHIKSNLTTDCFLAYEVVDIVTPLALRLEAKTGELMGPLSDAVKPIRETAKSSLSDLLDDVRRKIQALLVLPTDGASIPITAETMIRLQEMTSYSRPLASIMTSIGDGNWTTPPSTGSSTSTATLKSIDVGADGHQLLASYVTDTIDILLSNLETKARVLLKGKSVLGVFIANNVSVVDRMVRSSDLYSLLSASSSAARLETWRKKGTGLYLDAWRDPSSHLLDVQYTSRSPRPSSGSSGIIDSAAIIKGLSSKEKDAIKEKFKAFNTSFDELSAKHKSLSMEREVRSSLARAVQAMIEPLYSRFWDRYHQIDRGRGRYVKYDKGSFAAQLASMG